MSSSELTDAELLVLGLVAEMPRHGYQLEQEIVRRDLREWTPIGFSSIYFVLGKLGKKRLIKAGKQAGAKAKKVFTITKAGRRALVNQTEAALADYRPTHSSVLLGMAHWPLLEKDQALAALENRKKAISIELKRLEAIRLEQQPMPDFVEAIFDYSLGQLKAEADWVSRTLDYMRTKPWLS